MVNFGILYGISAFGLQQRLNIPRAEANELIDNYFEKYPGVRHYIDQTTIRLRPRARLCKNRNRTPAIPAGYQFTQPFLAECGGTTGHEQPDPGDGRRHAEAGHDQGPPALRPGRISKPKCC